MALTLMCFQPWPEACAMQMGVGSSAGQDSKGRAALSRAGRVRAPPKKVRGLPLPQGPLPIPEKAQRPRPASPALSQLLHRLLRLQATLGALGERTGDEMEYSQKILGPMTASRGDWRAQSCSKGPSSPCLIHSSRKPTSWAALVGPA